MDISTTNAEMTACERMYGADFRSEPVTIKEYGEVDKSDLYMDLAIKAYCKSTGTSEPHDYNCQSTEIFIDTVEYWAGQNLNVSITDDTLVVDIVNYKGEAEGISLYEVAKHLPVFVSKSASFFAVNKG